MANFQITNLSLPRQTVTAGHAIIGTLTVENIGAYADYAELSFNQSEIDANIYFGNVTELKPASNETVSMRLLAYDAFPYTTADDLSICVSTIEGVLTDCTFADFAILAVATYTYSRPATTDTLKCPSLELEIAIPVTVAAAVAVIAVVLRKYKNIELKGAFVSVLSDSS